MANIPTVKARDQLSEIINRAAYGKERIALTRRGRKLAAIVPIEDLELLESLEDRLDLDEARAALVEAKEKGSVSWEQIKKDLDL
ncbi:MAG: type II toxin-antitoxin system prevent-host-death family antitoxin [Dehalococcoidia bacterium]|nr:type II toxin-antitoxin system prevent-host-death family antitoxin [Dehalococcoidia bacterium]